MMTMFLTDGCNKSQIKMDRSAIASKRRHRDNQLTLSTVDVTALGAKHRMHSHICAMSRPTRLPYWAPTM